jgi:branched-chain amino acid transport system permease protein
MQLLQRIVSVAGVGALALAVPLLISDYNLRVMVLALQTAVAVIGLAVAFGWGGLIQLGQAAFIGVGAYTSAILVMRYGFNFWLAMPVAMLMSALVALVIAVPMLRLRGHYLALATVGLNVTAEIVMKNWTALTGGYDGISAIPGVRIFGNEITGDFGYYYLSLCFLAAVSLFAVLLRNSRFGRAMIAVRDDEIAAGTSGVAVVRTKVLAFVIASVLAGMSGALYAHYAHYISPQDFDLARSVTILVMLIAGGEMSIAGSIVGTIVLSFAPEWLRFVGDAYLAVFGVGVLLILILMPEGIAGRLKKILKARGPVLSIPNPLVAAVSERLTSRPLAGTSATGAAAPSILTVRGLSRNFGGLLAVDRVDLEVPTGRLLALIGPNGAGKSTIVNLLAGVLAPSSGSVRLGAADLTGKPAHAVARAGLVRTFQNGRLFTRLSVLENVLVGADGRFTTGFIATILRTPRFRTEERAMRTRSMALLDELGLAHDAGREVRELPYGKQRKIEIARALILEPTVLMLDEPAAGLNSGEVEELIAYVSGLRAQGLSIMLIEHNMGLVMRLADRIAVLNFGKLIADGPPAEVRGSETVIEAYLGRRKERHAAV